jgi:hypothetical protein
VEVAAGARELRQSASVIAKIFGAELEAMDKHIELADAGYTFLFGQLAGPRTHGPAARSRRVFEQAAGDPAEPP